MAEDQLKERHSTPELEEAPDDSSLDDSSLDEIVLSSAVFENSSEQLIGKTIGEKYLIESVLGTGGLGVVYRGFDVLLNQPVAIKALHPHKDIDANALMRFQREAQAAIGLKHQNIVGVQDFGLFDGIPFLIMEYVDGASLSTILQNEGKLEPHRALRLLKQLCAGLAVAHKSGVVHRDIKPQNLIVKKLPDGHEELKIIDFGIAKFVEGDETRNLTQTGDIFGTPNYMSPEQCEGKKTDQRSDLYSVGCVAYEMLTGNPPFTGDSTLEVLSKHIKQPAPILGIKAPRGLSKIVGRALEKLPSHRYSSAQAMLGDIELVMSGRDPKLVLQFGKRQFWAAVLMSGLMIFFVVVPYLSNVLFDRASLLKAQGKYNEAGDDFVNSWFLNLNNYDAVINAANCAYRVAVSRRSNYKDVSEAAHFRHTLNNANIAISMRPDDYRPYLYRAVSSAQFNGAFKEIVSDYETAIRLNPTNAGNNQVVAYVGLANYLNFSKDFDNALEAASKALELDRRSSGALSARAAAEVGLNRYKEAVKDATDAIALNDKCFDALLARAEAYTELRNFEAARRDLDTVIRSQDNFYKFHAFKLLSAISELEGKSKDADNQLDKAKQMQIILAPTLVDPFEK